MNVNAYEWRNPNAPPRLFPGDDRDFDEQVESLMESMPRHGFTRDLNYQTGYSSIRCRVSLQRGTTHISFTCGGRNWSSFPIWKYIYPDHVASRFDLRAGDAGAVAFMLNAIGKRFIEAERKDEWDSLTAAYDAATRATTTDVATHDAGEAEPTDKPTEPHAMNHAHQLLEIDNELAEAEGNTDQHD